MARNHPYKPSPSKKKDNSLRNAVIAFGVTILGYASIFSFHKLSDFLLGGGITAWDQLIPLLQETINRQVAEHDLPACPVVKRCRHMNGANLIGAVYNLKMKEK